MGKKSDCCKRYKRKGRPCDDCPKMARLSKKKQKKLLAVFD